MSKNNLNNRTKEIINKYNDGLSIEKIMTDCCCDEKYIRGILKEYQIDRHGNWRSKELDSRIAHFYSNTELKQYEIADILHISASGIRSTIDRLGIPLRTESQKRIKYQRNRHYFDIIDSPNKAYILGLLYADGCNHIDHNSITLSLQESEYYLLLRIKIEMEYEGDLRFIPLNQKNNNWKNQYTLCVNDEYMSQKLLDLGVVNNKSLILKFPTEEQVPSKYINHFLRGYFDGDGCISECNNKYRTCTAGTKEFCEGMSKILTQLGIQHNIRKPKQSIGSNTYTLYTSGNKSTYQLMHWLYQDSDIKMERKYHKYLELCSMYHKVA